MPSGAQATSSDAIPDGAPNAARLGLSSPGVFIPLVTMSMVLGSLAGIILALGRLRLAIPAHGEMGHVALISIEIVGPLETRIALAVATAAVVTNLALALVLLAAAAYLLRRRTLEAVTLGAWALIALAAAFGGTACIRGDIGP